MYPTCVTSVADAELFSPFRYTTNHFRDIGHLETTALNDLQTTLNPTRSNVPHICITTVPDSQISLHFAPASHFRETGHFETSAPNEAKMTMNHTKSHIPHICVSSIHDSHILLRFALRPAVSEIQAILRQVH